MLANGKHEVRISNSSSFPSKPAIWPEPSPIEKLNWLIHLQHIRGETDACKELIKNEITNTSRTSEYAFFKQGTILREEGKVQEALESFQICLKLNPDNVENLKQVAKCLYDMRRYRLSLEAYLEAENILKTSDWEIFYNIGLCCQRLGDIQRAKEYAHKAVKLGKHESSYSLLMTILINEGDFKSAIAISNAAVESCPDSIEMLTKSGILLLKVNQTQPAFERLSSALALDHNCSKALLGIGYITQRHEEYDVALTKYKAAILNESNSVALWNNIALCFYNKQKLVASISCLKRALWISSLNWKVLFNLGFVHLSANQSASAFNFICASVNLQPNVSESFSVLGCALIELKDYENSLRAFQQAVLLSPDNPQILLNMAICCYLLDNFKEVVELLGKLENLQENGVNVSQKVVELQHRLMSLMESNTTAESTNNGKSNGNEENNDCSKNVYSNVVIENDTSEKDQISSDELSPREMAADEV